MGDRTRRAGLTMRARYAPAVVVLLLLVAAWVALERSPLSEGARSIARRTLVFGGGLALALLMGAVAVVGLPAWVAASLAGVALVATGAYGVAAGVLGLPEIRPARDPGDPGDRCTPDRYGEMMSDGSICLGV